MAGTDIPKAHGQRMRKLEHAYQRTVKYALRGIPPDDVFAYFPEGPLADPIIETVYDAYRQVKNCAFNEARAIIIPIILCS